MSLKNQLRPGQSNGDNRTSKGAGASPKMLKVIFSSLVILLFTLGLNGKSQSAEARRTPGRSPTIKVKVYFNNDKLDPDISGDKVFPVPRQIVKTRAVARAALTELLKGPTAGEQAAGYRTSLNQGIKIQKLSIVNGVARVDFNAALEYRVAGSCRVTAIRAQISETLKQFPAVTKVIISINGRTDDILQP